MPLIPDGHHHLGAVAGFLDLLAHDPLLQPARGRKTSAIEPIGFVRDGDPGAGFIDDRQGRHGEGRLQGLIRDLGRKPQQFSLKFLEALHLDLDNVRHQNLRISA